MARMFRPRSYRQPRRATSKGKQYNPATGTVYSASDGHSSSRPSTNHAPASLRGLSGGNLRHVSNHPLSAAIQSTSGLILYYPMSEASGTVVRDNNNGLNPGASSGVTSVAGKVGTAYDFNGTSGYVQTTDSALIRFEGGNDFSVVFLVNLDSYNNNLLPRFFEKKSLYLALMGDSGNGKYRRVAIEVQNSTGLGNANAGASEFWGSTQLNTGQWYMIGASFDGNLVGTEPTVYQGKIYINGVAETMDVIFDWPTGADSTLQSTSAFDLYIGRRRTDQARNIDGKMQHFALFDRVLTPTEFQTLASLAGF